MSTRSRIGVQHGNVIKHIYCHFDGYPECNGMILEAHYNSVKANNLVALGDLSSLKPEIGEKHDFDYHFHKEDFTAAELEKFKGWCTFYGRDRGEEGVDYQVSHSFADFLDTVNGCCGEWYYLFKEGQWWVGSLHSEDRRHYRKLVPLSETLELIAEEETQ